MGLTIDLGRLHKPWVNQAHVPEEEKPLEWEAHAPQLERSPRSAAVRESSEDPAQPKTNKSKFKN